MTSPEPLLSVIVPAYRVEDYLAECLRSILVQPFADLEVLVIDDASPDSSGTIAQDFAVVDSRLRVITHHRNRGPGAARNTGLDQARGHYVAFVDSDDLVGVDAYRRIISTLERTGSDFATSPAQEFGQGARKRYWTTDLAIFATGGERLELAGAPELVRDHTTWTKVYRREFLLRHQIRWPEGVLHEDVAPSVLSYCRATSFDVLTEPAYFYRRRSHSMRAASGAEEVLADWAEQTDHAMQLLRGAGVSVLALAEFTKTALLSELVPRLDSLAKATPSTTTACAQLTRQLITYCPSASLVELNGTQRWQLALLLLKLPTLIPLVKDPDDRWEGPLDRAALDGPLPEELRSILGLGEASVAHAFEERFLRAPAFQGDSAGADSGTDPNETPEVSVVIPTHNVEEYIDELLRSLRAAQGVHLEMLVIDDWSTDRTWESIQRHAAADPRVRAFRSPGRGGGQARNYGVELARGEYLAFADGDDLVPATAYAALLRSARRTTADVVMGSYLHFRETTTANTGAVRGFDVQYDDIALRAHPRLFRYRVVWNRLVRREFWLQHTLPFPDVPRCNDNVAITSLLTSPAKFTVIPDIVYIYRDRPGSNSMTAQAHSPYSTASFLSEEIIASQLVDQTGDDAVRKAYWTVILGQVGWFNLRSYLHYWAERPEPVADAEVIRLFNQLVERAPEWVYSRLPLDTQAIYALLRSGALAEAHRLLPPIERSGITPPPEAIQAIRVLSDVPSVDAVVLSEAIWRFMVRGLIAGRRELTIEIAGQAVELMQSITDRYDIHVPVLPGSWEERVAAALQRGTAEDLQAVLSPGTEKLSTWLQIGPGRAWVKGRAHQLIGPGCLVVAEIERGQAVTRIPLGRVEVDAIGGWRAELNVRRVRGRGPWRPVIESSDQWGIRRLRPRLRISRRSAALRWLGPVAVQGSSRDAQLVTKSVLGIGPRRFQSRSGLSTSTKSTE